MESNKTVAEAMSEWISLARDAVKDFNLNPDPDPLAHISLDEKSIDLAKRFAEAAQEYHDIFGNAIIGFGPRDASIDFHIKAPRFEILINFNREQISAYGDSNSDEFVLELSSADPTQIAKAYGSWARQVSSVDVIADTPKIEVIDEFDIKGRGKVIVSRDNPEVKLFMTQKINCLFKDGRTRLARIRGIEHFRTISDGGRKGLLISYLDDPKESEVNKLPTRPEKLPPKEVVFGIMMAQSQKIKAGLDND